MGAYILSRLAQLVPVLLGISLVTFLLLYIVPGDPARLLAPQRLDPEARAAARRQWNLDRPLPLQYLLLIGRIVTLDLGTSWQEQGVPVRTILWEHFKATAALAAAGLAIAVVFGMTAGVLSAVRTHGLVDYAAMVLALLGVSTPAFWLGMILIDLCSARLGWLPAATSASPGLADLVLPAVTLGLVSMGTIARLTRAAMLDVLAEDYVRTARAKGLSGRVVVLRHALRNALAPVVTVIGANFGYLLSGAVLTETVFGWPGLGRRLVQAIQARDQPVVMAGVVYVAVVFVLANLVVDILYACIDPRVRYGTGRHET